MTWSEKRLSLKLVGKFGWTYVLIKIAQWEGDGPSGLARTPKWPKKLARQAPVEIESIWISFGLVAKLGKKTEESGVSPERRVCEG